jgi:hypothetical protein
MRHSDPKLTANVYTDPRLLDVHGALDALPTLPLDDGSATGRGSLPTTGTDDHHSVALTLAPNLVQAGQTKAFPDKGAVKSPASLGPAQTSEIRGFSGDFPGFPGVAADIIQVRAISSVG